MTEEKIKKGTELLQSIEKYKEAIMSLNTDVREAKDLIKISRLTFKTQGGGSVYEMYGEEELIQTITKIVVREYSKRLADLETQFDIL